MRTKKTESDIETREIEACKEKIQAVLREFNCQIISQDGWHGCLIEDKDTKKTVSI